MKKVISSDWRIEILGNCVDILDSQRIPLNNEERESRIQGKALNKLYPYYGATQQVGYIDDYIFDEELILLGEDGVLFYDRDKTKAYIVSGKFWVNNHAHVLRARNGNLNRFINYYLNMFDYHGYVNGTTRLKLTQSNLKEIPISLPPISQQEKIVSVLDTASALVEKQKALLEKYDLFLKSKFIEMFGDPVKNPMRWEEVNIGQITQVQTGKTPSRKNMEYWDNGTENWAKTTEANLEVIYDTEEKITLKAVRENNLIIFPVNTILIAMYGQGKTRGKVVRLGSPSTINQAFGAILPSEKYNVFFMIALLDSLYQDIRDLGRGGNQENLNLDIVRKIEIILPPIDLQNQFAQIVEQLDNIKQKEHQKLEKLQILYDALMKQAFDGEIK